MTTQTKNALRGGEFLIKESTTQDIFVREELNEEQLMIADMCREFIEANIDPNLDRIDALEEGLVPELMDKAAELGMLGLSIPEEYGGFGKDFNTNSAASEVLGGAHSFAVSIAAHTGIGTLPILYFGTEEQKQKYLPKSASGELKFAYCLTEPGSGSDALAAKSKAVLNDAGTHYIVNGQKMWITNGGFADVFVVFAKIDGEHFTGFIIERDYEGVSVGAEEKKMGIKGSSTRQVFFENVSVPKENVLGEIGKGHLIAFNILNIGRYKLCAMALGGCKKALTASISYANERNQFDTPISSFGAIQHKLAEMAIKIFVCDSVTYRVSDYIDVMEKELLEQGKNYGEALLGAAEEYAIECAMLKVFGSEVLDYVVDESVQVFGGYGFSEEYPVARAYRDARINRIFEGTNEINRMLTIDMLTKRAMAGKLDLLSPALAVQKELTSVPDFGSSDDETPFAEEKKAIKNAKKAALMIAGAAIQKLMKQLRHEQEIMMNVADMLIEIFACESTILHAEKLIEIKGASEAAVYGDMAKVYVNDAVDRIHKSGKDAIAAFADGDEQKMMLVGLKRFTKFGPVNTKELRRNIASKLIEANKYCF